MSVVELQHPEDLLDKLELGSLGVSERERLDAHLRVCATCRMELAMRRDFAAEAPLALPELPQLTLEHPEPEPRPSGVVPRPSGVVPRPNRKRRFSLLAIAAAWCASSALAATAAISTVRGPLAAWFGLKEAPALPSNGSTPSHKPARVKSSLAARSAVTAPEASSTAPEGASATPELNASAPSEPAAAAPSSLAAVAPVRPTLRAAGPHDDALPATEMPSASSSNTAAFPSLPAETAPPDAAGLLAEADRARRSGNAGRAIALYRELEQSYPSSPESQLSIALVAKLLLDGGDPAAAEAAYERYLSFGSASLRAEALVGRARSLEALGRTSDAIAAWQEVQRRVPGSVHARLAAARLAALSVR